MQLRPAHYVAIRFIQVLKNCVTPATAAESGNRLQPGPAKKTIQTAEADVETVQTCVVTFKCTMHQRSR